MSILATCIIVGITYWFQCFAYKIYNQNYLPILHILTVFYYRSIPNTVIGLEQVFRFFKLVGNMFV